MAFTNSWSASSPAGTDNISDGDDAIRTFKLDIAERLDSICASGFGVTDNNDPLRISTTRLVVIDGSADEIQLRVQGHSTQTTSLVVLENSAGTDLLTMETAGQLTLPVSGSSAGLLLGGDALLYRVSANLLRTPDALTVDGALIASSTLAVTSGVTFSTALTVANGGTGATSLTDGGILLGSGTGAITALGVATNGQIPIGDGTTDPVLATLTGTAAKVTVTNGGGSITLTLPDVLTLVTPTVTGVFNADGGSIFNEDSADVDFRIEGANNANLFVLDGGQDAISIGGANVDGAALTLNNLTTRTFITSVGSQFHTPAQATAFDNGSETIAVGAGAFFGIPTWTNGTSTLTITDAATVYIEGVPVDSTDVTHTNEHALMVAAGSVRIGATGTQDGHVHILSPATGTIPLIIESPTSSSVAQVVFHYAGGDRLEFKGNATLNRLFFSEADLGDDNLGSHAIFGRNNNASQDSGGCMAMVDLGNTTYWIHADNTGDLRMGTTAPIGSADLTNGLVSAQTSPEAIKNILSTYSNLPDAKMHERFQEVLDTPIHDFNFKNGKYDGEQFVGMAMKSGENPWYGYDAAKPDTYIDDQFIQEGTAKALNEMSIPGYLILAIKVLNQRIEELENGRN